MFRRRSDEPSDATTSTPSSMFARPVRNSIRAPASIYTRQQHIDSYLKDSQLAPSTRKVSEDDSTYDTVFQSVAGDTLILRVHWPQQQQLQRPPAMTLAGVEARHAWLDGRMRITGYPPIQNEPNWRDSKELLGTAVLNVIKHLQLQPPSIVRFVDSGLIAIQNNTKTAAATTNIPEQSPSRRRRAGTQQQHESTPPPAYDAMQLSSAAPPAPPPPRPNVDLPTIPKQFPQLDHLSRQELEELNSDELAFKAFCNRLPIMAEYHDIQSKLLNENAQTARTNLESESKLRELHATVTNLQTQLATKVANFQKLEKAQDEICQPPDTRKVCRDLTKAKRQAFDESERIADDWLSSSSCGDSIDDFCRSFLDRRKVHHVRAAKLELLERNNVGGANGTR